MTGRCINENLRQYSNRMFEKILEKTAETAIPGFLPEPIGMQIERQGWYRPYELSWSLTL